MPTVVNVLVRRAVEDDLDGILSVGHRTWPPTYEPIAGADYVAMGLAKWWSAESHAPGDPRRPDDGGRARRRRRRGRERRTP